MRVLGSSVTGGGLEHTESASFRGAVIQTPYYPDVAPYRYSTRNVYNSVNGHVYRLTPLSTTICEHGEVLVNGAEDLCP